MPVRMRGVPVGVSDVGYGCRVKRSIVFAPWARARGQWVQAGPRITSPASLAGRRRREEALPPLHRDPNARNLGPEAGVWPRPVSRTKAVRSAWSAGLTHRVEALLRWLSVRSKGKRHADLTSRDRPDAPIWHLASDEICSELRASHAREVLGCARACADDHDTKCGKERWS